MSRNIFFAIATTLSLSALAVNASSLEKQHPDIDARILAEMNQQDCLDCHGSPSAAIIPADSGYLPDRHHLRVDTPISAQSASPFPEKSPNGKHQCVTCHLVDWVTNPALPAGGNYQFKLEPEFRDCLFCHKLAEDDMGFETGDIVNLGFADGITSFANSPHGDSPPQPIIKELSEAAIAAGSETHLVILGTGFASPHSTSSHEQPWYSWAGLTNRSGKVVKIIPEYISPTQMELAIPKTLEPGNYSLTVNNQNRYSGVILASSPTILSIVPSISVESVRCHYSTISIDGSGFSSHYLDAQHSGTEVAAGADGDKCAVESWSDRRIVVNCSSGIGDLIRITTLYDSISLETSCGNNYTAPKWWSIWKWWSAWSWQRR